KLAHRDLARAPAYGALKGVVWYKRIDKRAVEGLCRAPQRLQLNAATLFRLLQRLDALRPNREPSCKLHARHAEGIPDGPHPPFWRRVEPRHGLEPLETIVEPFPGAVACTSVHTVA